MSIRKSTAKWTDCDRINILSGACSDVGLRAAVPKRSSFAVAQFDTLRLRLIRIAARRVEMKTQIRLRLPTSCPDQRILRIVLDRIPGARDIATGRRRPENKPADRNPQTRLLSRLITAVHEACQKSTAAAAGSPMQAAESRSPCIKAG
ncbi:transposase [Mesorhizobium sp. M0909]|uniref:transposase n=1 Tax=Mesorhizobium sp. M0909 TaxID=2957024 RepID=UPI00333D2563